MTTTTTTTGTQDQTNLPDKIAAEVGCTVADARMLVAASEDFVRAYCGDVETTSGVFRRFGAYQPYSWSEPDDPKAPIYARVVVDRRPGYGYAVRIAAHVPDAYWHTRNRSYPGRPGRFGYVEPQADKIVPSVREAAAFLLAEAARVRTMAAAAAAATSAAS